MRKMLTPVLMIALVLGGGLTAYSYLGHTGALAWARGMVGGGCGMGNWGQAGGGDFRPQAGGQQLGGAAQPQLGPERARDIVSGYVARMNPSFQVSRATDAGPYYAFDVTDGGQAVQRLGVDKASGLIRPLQ